jgi:hypothetical protein
MIPAGSGKASRILLIVSRRLCLQVLQHFNTALKFFQREIFPSQPALIGKPFPNRGELK